MTQNTMWFQGKKCGTSTQGSPHHTPELPPEPHSPFPAPPPRAGDGPWGASGGEGGLTGGRPPSTGNCTCPEPHPASPQPGSRPPEDAAHGSRRQVAATMHRSLVAGSSWGVRACPVTRTRQLRAPLLPPSPQLTLPPNLAPGLNNLDADHRDQREIEPSGSCEGS